MEGNREKRRGIFLTLAGGMSQNNFTVFLVFNISIHPSKFVFAAIFVLFSKQGWLE